MKKLWINGILNVTPDSIDQTGELLSVDETLDKANQLIKDGADNLDIGAQATNPWASPISPEEEWSRLEPVIVELTENYPGRLILDTFNPSVAEKALQFGEFKLNDVTMFHNKEMVNLAVKYQTVCFLGHLPIAANGSIVWAHQNPKMNSEIDVLNELLVKRRQMINMGVNPENIIIDPDIGFGKTPQLNRRLLEFGKLLTDRFLLQKLDNECLKEPIIKVEIGHSQKRMIEQYFGGDKHDPSANIKAAQIAINSGASYLRVHNPKLYKNLKKSN